MGLLDGLRSRMAGSSLFGAAKAPQFAVGAFGKHPGWDDHLDDLGLDSEALLAAKHLIYSNGIGKVIDSGQWDAYGDDALPEFSHLLVWLSGADLLAGRIWSSSDGKGRKKYPMIVCAHFDAGVLAARLAWIQPWLERWEAACKEAAQAQQVRQIVSEGRTNALPTLPASDFPSLPGSDPQFLERLNLAADGEAMARILYAIESYLTPFAAKNPDAGKLGLNLRLGQSSLVSQHLRLPADPDAPLETLAFWRRLLAISIAPAAPQLFLFPSGEAWVDVIVGLPGEKVICLKAKPKVLPLISDVPFTLSDDFRTRAAATMRGLLSGSS